MDTKILKGTLLGTVVFFLLGWLVYGILLADFMATNYNTCNNRPNGEMEWWAIIVSNLAMALLLTLFLKWSNSKVFSDGLKIGALYGFLLGTGIDLSFYSMTTMFNSLSILIVDVLVNTVLMAIIGMVIVLLWGKEKQPE
ncbi:MAG: DUF1761 domain-containing protein [Prolixibacteraceae bacterium]